jgi:hypothetical protein
MSTMADTGADSQNSEDGVMARTSTSEIRTAVVAAYIERLRQAALERQSFDAVMATMKSDKFLRPTEAIEIALAYVGGGTKPASKSAALAAISSRFVERVRAQEKSKIARSVRAW